MRTLVLRNIVTTTTTKSTVIGLSNRIKGWKKEWTGEKNSSNHLVWTKEKKLKYKAHAWEFDRNFDVFIKVAAIEDYRAERIPKK